MLRPVARPRRGATALLLALLALVLGLRRGGPARRGDLPKAVPPPAPAQLRSWVIAGSLAFAALTASLIYAGYEIKRDREARATAIALTGGDPDLAPALMVAYGCGGCHMIEGVSGAAGMVGPPLDDLARRIYIAGVLRNRPDDLIRWIVDPPAVDPQTAMPVTGISPEEARHVAAYLYALR